MLAFWKGDDFAENLEYGLAGTPCQARDRRAAALLSRPARGSSSRSTRGSSNWQAESFLGIPMRGQAGRVDRPPRRSSIDRPMREQSSRGLGAADLRRSRGGRARAPPRADRARGARRTGSRPRTSTSRRRSAPQHNFEEIVGNSPALLAASRRRSSGSRRPTRRCSSRARPAPARSSSRARSTAAARAASGPSSRSTARAIPAGLVESELFGHEQGRVHRRARAAHRPLRAGRRRHALPRRGRRAAARHPGQAAARAPGAGVRAGRRQPDDPRRRARHRRHQPRPRAGGRTRDASAPTSSTGSTSFPVAMPPLRERAGGHPAARRVLRRRSLEAARQARSRGSAAAAWSGCAAYAWPGNVRELQNVIERAAILSAGPILELERDLVERRRDRRPLPAADARRAGTRPHPRHVLKSTRGIVEGPRGAARILGLNPNTLRSRLKKLSVTPRREIS